MSSPLLSVEDHLEQVLALGQRLPPQWCPIDEGLGRVLADDVSARVAVPPFDNSAMDGFAVRSCDLVTGARLRVVGDIPAGATSWSSIGPGEAARIMTGAPMPPGADCVVPVELTDQPWGDVALPAFVVVHETVPAGRHVRQRGEDVEVNEVVLPAGLRWTPGAASSAASLGHGQVRLVARPRVSVIATGSELVAPGHRLGPGQIPDSNSSLVAGLLSSFGADLGPVLRVGDDPQALRAALAEATAASDLVVTTGGVSVGAFEVVRQVVEGEVTFTGVAMQPGKPQACGLVTAPDGRRVPLLGLPGNPVSVFVSSWLFVRPLVAKLGGWPADWPGDGLRDRPGVDLPASEGWRSPPGRRQYLPARRVNSGVEPVHRLGSGSHLVASLALADCLVVVDEQVTEVKAGDLVGVLPLHGPRVGP
ncbi:gephyrin-like molybdotransferase Glp [Aestuariimicrobium kwangyangense]|uniref:molybdopterin molybdotransferase MoeA n=1 Tax=Aestuariimicrobium kwangyangense TaxID=396389 RepID=UPI0003B4BBE8|nr:gephyrin-like molybdotransferase Glp [Aestuariimicrobium kwangyangense]